MPNSYADVYKLSCECGGGYMGETEKRVLTWLTEHQKNSMTEKWEALGAIEDSKHCHLWFNWLDPETLPKLPNMHKRKIRESLETNKLREKIKYNKSIKV